MDSAYFTDKKDDDIKNDVLKKKSVLTFATQFINNEMISVRAHSPSTTNILGTVTAVVHRPLDQITSQD